MPGFGTYPQDVSPSGRIVGVSIRDCTGPDEWGGYADCVDDTVVWDDRVSPPRVVRAGSRPAGINARDQVVVNLADWAGAEVIDLTTGAVTPLVVPADVVGLFGSEIGDDLVFGGLVVRRPGPLDELSSAETVSFVFDLRSGTLTRLADAETYGHLADSGLSVRDEVLFGLYSGALTVPSLDIPDQYGPGEVFGWSVDAQGQVYGTSTYPAPDSCHTDFPCRRVYAWDPESGVLRDLGTPGSQHPGVEDVNDVGQIVVHDGGPDPEHRSVPWVWSPDTGQWVELPCPVDQPQCTPTAIGDDGTVYGYLFGSGGLPLEDAVYWPPTSS